jgi:hypothetical protein
MDSVLKSYGTSVNLTGFTYITCLTGPAFFFACLTGLDFFSSLTRLINTVQICGMFQPVSNKQWKFKYDVRFFDFWTGGCASLVTFRPSGGERIVLARRI